MNLQITRAVRSNEIWNQFTYSQTSKCLIIHKMITNNNKKHYSFVFLPKLFWAPIPITFHLKTHLLVNLLLPCCPVFWQTGILLHTKKPPAITLCEMMIDKTWTFWGFDITTWFALLSTTDFSFQENCELQVSSGLF